jgi:aminoglycoside phosphotransferase (APT) family kinase protein
VLSRPAGLDDGVLARALEEGWGLRPASLAYAPVGAGSHHWRADGIDGRRWFVTVDDLAAARDDPGEVFDRLAAAFGAARALREHGAGFVVAPVPSLRDEIVRALDGRWALAVYPFVEGEGFAGGSARPTGDRLAVVDLLAGLHTVDLPAPSRPRPDDEDLPNRRDLEGAVRHSAMVLAPGPHAAGVTVLLEEHAPLVEMLLAEHDDRVAATRRLGHRHVPTHGEPHAGNTMRTRRGWVLIDWDSARMAPPERDLWLLETGDGTATAAYEARTGKPVLPELLDLYRLRWELKDLGFDVAVLAGPAPAGPDAERSARGIAGTLSRLAAGGGRPPAAW